MKPFSTPISSPYTSVPEMWQSAVETAADRPFLYSFDSSMSFAETDERVLKLSAALHQAGVGAGDRVALYSQNDPIFVIGLLATLRVGGIAVPVNPMNTVRELKYQLDDSGARALITIPGLYETVVREALGDSSTIATIVGGHEYWDTDGQELEVDSAELRTGLRDGDLRAEAVFDRDAGGVPSMAPMDAADRAVLTYTSGTTGMPKGAQNTHGNLVFNAESYLEITGLHEGEPILGIAPLFHITGMVGHLMLAIRARCPVVLSHRFNAEMTLRMLRAWKPVFTVGAITALMALADSPKRRSNDFESLRTVYSGGAPIAPALADRLERTFGAFVHNIYGMSETSSPTHAVPRGERAPVDATSGALSIGKPIYNTRSKIVDEAGNECSSGTYGEILSAGPQITSGYWERPDATRDAFDGDYLRTGDVGFVDADGWFYLVDRKKDMINAAGYKVWPREVEDVLYGHPAVSEVAVAGVPDEYRGETVKAFVTVKAGTRVSAEELEDYCKANMAAYKYPRTIEFLPELPKTSTGKILRRQLRD